MIEIPVIPMIGIPVTSHYAQRIRIQPMAGMELAFYSDDDLRFVEIVDSAHPGITPPFGSSYTQIIDRTTGEILWDRETDGFYRTVTVHEFHLDYTEEQINTRIASVKKRHAPVTDEEQEPTPDQLDKLEKELGI